MMRPHKLVLSDPANHLSPLDAAIAVRFGLPFDKPGGIVGGVDVL